MTRIDLVDGRLCIEVLGWDKLWSFKSRLEFPLARVVSIRPWTKEKDRAFLGLRCPGTCLPGVIVAGTYYRKRQRHFYDVHRFDRALVIELEGEKFAKVVVEVEDLEATLRQVANSRSGVGALSS
jgi:hypothetical protein